MVHYRRDTKARIEWEHVDGPLLICRDGTTHFLTRAERIWLRMGLTSIEELDAKHNKEPQRG